MRAPLRAQAPGSAAGQHVSCDCHAGCQALERRPASAASSNRNGWTIGRGHPGAGEGVEPSRQSVGGPMMARRSIMSSVTAAEVRGRGPWPASRRGSRAPRRRSRTRRRSGCRPRWRSTGPSCGGGAARAAGTSSVTTIWKRLTTSSSRRVAPGPRGADAGRAPACAAPPRPA